MFDSTSLKCPEKVSLKGQKVDESLLDPKRGIVRLQTFRDGDLSGHCAVVMAVHSVALQTIPELYTWICFRVICSHFQ